MNLLDRIFGQKPSAALDRDPFDDHWFSPLGHGTSAGVHVTTQNALTLPVVWDCLNVLSGTIGALPFGIFERGGDGSKTRQDRHPISQVLRNPNPETTSAEFFTQMVWDLSVEGNFYAAIIQGDLGPISKLWRLDPARMTVERLTDGSRRWVYQDESGTTKNYVEGEIWHIRRPPIVKALIGTSPIAAGREAISTALALQDYTARFFRNDATPPFVITVAANFKDDESRKNYLKAIKTWWSGKRRHAPGVLDNDAKLQKVGVSNEEAQFLETRNALGLELTRIWHMQPHKVGILDKATFSNIEQQSLEFVTDTLLPPIDLIEKSIAKDLITYSGRYFFEFNVNGLLRGDTKSRFEAYSQGRQWGWLSVNEIRRLENMNPITGGDVYMQPLNMVPAGSDPRRTENSSAKIYGPDGAEVSRIVGGQVVRMADYKSRNANAA